jgi:small-conductance mechanosensitive channel
VADKESEDKSKAMREIERLAKEQSKEEAEASKKEKEAEVRSKKEIEAEGKKAKKEAEKLAREKAKKEAEEAKRAKKEAERLAKEQAKQDKKDKKDKKEAIQDVSSVISEGNFQLVLPSSVGFKQLKQFTDHLAGVKDIKIVWTGGSTDEGILIAVSVAQAVPLAQILSEMPMVEGVEVKGEKITITPKGPA